MNDEAKRSAELEQARLLLRAIEPPEGAKQRVEQALLLQNARDRTRAGWRWGLGLAFLAATSAAAVGDYIPVRSILQVVQGGGNIPTLESPGLKPPTHRQSGLQPLPEKPPESSLDVVEPTAPTAEPVSPTTPQAVDATRRVSHPHATKRPVASEALPPSELARLVTEFEQAKVFAKDDPARGLTAFRSLQQRWPHSPLSPEIDLQVVSLLNRLGKHNESQRESAAFVHEHPDSPRAKELEHALQAGGARN